MTVQPDDAIAEDAIEFHDDAFAGVCFRNSKCPSVPPYGSLCKLSADRFVAVIANRFVFTINEILLYRPIVREIERPPIFIVEINFGGTACFAGLCERCFNAVTEISFGRRRIAEMEFPSVIEQELFAHGILILSRQDTPRPKHQPK